MDGGAVRHNFGRGPLPRNHPCKICFNMVQQKFASIHVCALIWFSSFRKDLNVIHYLNMTNLHNRYRLAESKIKKENTKYMLHYSFPCSYN